MEPRYLLILEVSQKQAYIFGSRKLRDNLKRSQNIREATTEEFFQKCCGAEFSTDENLVYSGGGHAVLQFDDGAHAHRVAEMITGEVLRRWPGMEMYAKRMPYDPQKSPGENLNLLNAELEKKKALRLASFHRYSFGIDIEIHSIDVPNLTAEEIATKEAEEEKNEPFFREWKLTADGEKLAGNDNFLAVVHIDGNAMGTRVQKIYQKAGNDWDMCRRLLRQFSEEIDAHFEEAYQEMCVELSEKLYSLGLEAGRGGCFPVRRIIGAGDDVCFVCAGKLGISCAVSFIRHLSGKSNSDEQGYAACAGVCMIHKKYPFRAAYDLTEQLCANAKRFGVSYDNKGGISAIDWHIEFGQLKDNLGEIRSDYTTDDGGRMELRPYSVIGENVPPLRTFSFFCTVLQQLSTETGSLPRSKVKALRDAFRQGEIETALALRSARVKHLLELGVEARTPDWLEQTLREGSVAKSAFLSDGATRRCLYFDAIELMDHIVLWEDLT